MKKAIFRLGTLQSVDASPLNNWYRQLIEQSTAQQLLWKDYKSLLCHLTSRKNIRCSVVGESLWGTSGSWNEENHGKWATDKSRTGLLLNYRIPALKLLVDPLPVGRSCIDRNATDGIRKAPFLNSGRHQYIYSFHFLFYEKKFLKFVCCRIKNCYFLTHLQYNYPVIIQKVSIFLYTF